MYEYIFFDLDGTLIDPKEGITKSVQYALDKFNIRVNNLDELTVFIGPPLKDSFMEYYHMTKDEATLAIKYYRERFKVYGICECTLYNNVINTLDTLKSLNKKLVIATSKPEEFTIEILKKLDIYKYFDFIAGATFNGARSKKSDIIKYAIKSLNILDLSKVIMVGDRKFDILGAKTNNISSVGVTYGYALNNELQECKSDYIINDLLELINIIKK